MKRTKVEYHILTRRHTNDPWRWHADAIDERDAEMRIRKMLFMRSWHGKYLQAKIEKVWVPVITEGCSNYDVD